MNTDPCQCFCHRYPNTYFSYCHCNCRKYKIYGTDVDEIYRNDNKWISVKNALPSDRRFVLLRILDDWRYHDNYKLSIHYVIGRRIVFSNGKSKWQDHRRGRIETINNTVRVTHWMDIPYHSDDKLIEQEKK